ncbi:MAG: H-type small acid-soluble spore protein [Peptococcaceae bacterium]|nr:H-type small acid-soluble spore protein [Peptococcaceae bacterium]
MDFKRAQEIVNSEETIEVLNNGVPVWIENLNPAKNTATVRPLEGPEIVREVPVTELVEG